MNGLTIEVAELNGFCGPFRCADCIRIKLFAFRLDMFVMSDNRYASTRICLKLTVNDSSSHYQLAAAPQA